MKAIFKREMKAYFTSPIGYIVCAILLFLMGLYFSFMCANNYANISFVFMSVSSISLLVCPIITMRSMSEDKKQKVDQLLLTAPIKTRKIVGGKFLAAFTLYLIPFAITLIYNLYLMLSTSVNWLLYLSNFVGIALLGAAVLAIGIFVSALTESQIIAAVLGFVISFVIMQIDYFSQTVNNEIFTKVCTALSFLARFNAFTSGQVDFSNIIFFLSVTFLFLFLTNLSLDRKRWA